MSRSRFIALALFAAASAAAQVTVEPPLAKDAPEPAPTYGKRGVQEVEETRSHVGSVIIIERTIVTERTCTSPYEEVIVPGLREKNFAFGMLMGVFPEAMTEDHRGFAPGPGPQVYTLDEMREKLGVCEGCGGKKEAIASLRFESIRRDLKGHDAVVYRVRYRPPQKERGGLSGGLKLIDPKKCPSDD